MSINIEAIAVYVRIDGKTFLAPISAEGAHAFIQIAAAFQPGQPELTKLIAMPESVSSLVDAAGVTLGALIDAIKAEKAAAA